MSAPRVVSLVPSVTETLLAWGVTPVGVTRFCEQPSLPAVGGTKDPDLDAVEALAPDLVVMCEEENRREDAEELTGRGLAIHVVRIDALDDVAPALAALADALGRAPDLSGAGPRGASEPAPRIRCRAFVPVWRRPWMTLSDGTYGASLLASLGVEVVGPDATGDRYPTVTLEEVTAAAPDLVLAPSEPYPFAERHRAELEQVAPVVFVDGQDLFWWGVRTPDARGRLARVVDGAVTGA